MFIIAAAAVHRDLGITLLGRRAYLIVAGSPFQRDCIVAARLTARARDCPTEGGQHVIAGASVEKRLRDGATAVTGDDVGVEDVVAAVAEELE